MSARSVLAHGDHGEAARPEGGVSIVSFAGFQAELLTAPSPPRAGEEIKIIANILRNGSFEPVRDGRVFMGISPATSTRDPRGRVRASAIDGASGTSPVLAPAPEMTWAGNYTLVNKPERPGRYVIQVAVRQLGEALFDPPHVLEFYLDVAPPAGFGFGLMLLFVAATAIGAGGIYWAAVRIKPGADFSRPFNLLEIGWLNRFVRWYGFQPILQIPVLVVTVAILLLGFFDIQDGGKNPATKLTWIIWWPGIIFTFILVGRLWCVACPFGVLNEAAARWAKPGRMFPKALRNLWIATLLFVALTWADEQLGIIRSPRMTAWLILWLAVVSIATGLLYQRRSFCRYLCPITGLQGLYSMISPVELRRVDRDLCSRDCRQDCYRGNAAAAGCPMFEFPMTVDRNFYCNFCFECVKSCPQENLTLRFRSFGKDLWTSARRSLDESYLALALVGLTMAVTAQMLSGWNGWISGLSRLIPGDLRMLMKPVTYLTLTETLLFLVTSLILAPLLGYLAAWAGDRTARGRWGAKRTFVTFGYMFIPVGLAMHLAHNTSHLLLEGRGIVPSLQRMISQYTPFNLGAPDWQAAPLIAPNVVYAIQMTLILTGLLFSIVAGVRLAAAFEKRSVAGKALIPFLALALLFTFVNLYLLNQSMGMRHGM